jgi:hypothetical protein
MLGKSYISFSTRKVYKQTLVSIVLGNNTGATSPVHRRSHYDLAYKDRH